MKLLWASALGFLWKKNHHILKREHLVFYQKWDFKSLNLSETQSWAQIEPESGLALIRPIRDCLESFLSVADKLPADQLRQGDFENSNFKLIHYFYSMFFIPLIKFDTTNNSRDFKHTNIKVFFWNLRSLDTEDPSLKERKPQSGWFLINSRSSKTRVLIWALLGSKQTQRPGFTWV